MSTNRPPPRNPPGAGAGERTVIVRPNPGGRRDVQHTPPQQPPAGADVWGNEDPFAPHQPPPHHPPQHYQHASRQAPPHAPPRAASPPIDLGLGQHPDVPGPNPVMNAARPLLVLLANLRLSADHSQVAPMMDSIAETITAIDRDLAQQGLSSEHLRLAKYALCATADDIVQNLPGSDRLLWTQYSMLSRFFGATTSGVGFFDELNRTKAQPTLNYDVLELMHACLSLGFQGQYRSGAGGDVALQQIRRDLYQTLRTFKPRAGEDISPHWKGQDLKPKSMRSRVPVWAVASAAALLLFGVFVGYRILLGFSSEALADRILSIHSLSEVRLARDAPKPPPAAGESTQLQRVRAGLTEEIQGQKVEVFEARGRIVVKLLSDALFETGSADIQKDFIPAIEKAASILDHEPKNISVVGHTDNVKLRSRHRFKDNQNLSEERAKAVAALMAPKLADPARLEISGLGDTSPIKDNKTKEGRAANRRVEIFLPRTGP